MKNILLFILVLPCCSTPMEQTTTTTSDGTVTMTQKPIPTPVDPIEQMMFDAGVELMKSSF